MATFWPSCTKLSLVLNSPGANTEKATMIATRAANVAIVGLRNSVLYQGSWVAMGSAMSAVSAGTGVLVRTLMPRPLRW